jgi:hypothetical protein
MRFDGQTALQPPPGQPPKQRPLTSDHLSLPELQLLGLERLEARSVRPIELDATEQAAVERHRCTKRIARERRHGPRHTKNMVMNMQKFQSGFLRAEDLEPGVTYERTISEVEEVGFDDATKAVIRFADESPGVVLNQTRFHALIAAFGPVSENRLGKTIRVMRGATQYGGKTVPAIVAEADKTPRVGGAKPVPRLEAHPRSAIESWKPPPDGDDIPFAPEWR